jgi:hypothetical protein
MAQPTGATPTTRGGLGNVADVILDIVDPISPAISENSWRVTWPDIVGIPQSWFEQNG